MKDKTFLVVLIENPVTTNGGWACIAESCEKLVIMKHGVKLELNGSELAELYNLIRPVGNAPKYDDPDPV